MDTVFIDGVKHKIGAHSKAFRWINDEWVLSPKPASAVINAIFRRDNPEVIAAKPAKPLTPGQRAAKAATGARRYKQKKLEQAEKEARYWRKKLNNNET